MGEAAPDNSTVRILIIDDHPLIRKGLATVIDSVDRFSVCGEVAAASEALRLVLDQKPDLAIVDLTLEDGHGLELIKQIRNSDVETVTLAVSMHDESLFAERVLQAGAMGYVHKARALDEIVSAIEQVLTGRIYLSPEASDRILRQRTKGGEGKHQNSVELLSDRELSVFELIGQGLTTRQIAEKLFLSHKTVETHRERIKKKLGLENSAALVKHAVEWTMRETGGSGRSSDDPPKNDG